MAEAEAEIERDTERVAELGARLLTRYGGTSTPPEVDEAIRAQAAKRVALRFRIQRVASWDHRKLEGSY